MLSQSSETRTDSGQEIPAGSLYHGRDGKGKGVGRGVGSWNFGQRLGGNNRNPEEKQEQP